MAMDWPAAASDCRHDFAAISCDFQHDGFIARVAALAELENFRVVRRLAMIRGKPLYAWAIAIVGYLPMRYIVIPLLDRMTFGGGPGSREKGGAN